MKAEDAADPALWPTIVIGDAAEGRLVLSALRQTRWTGLRLLSPPDAACFLGSAWWRALIGQLSEPGAMPAPAEAPATTIVDLLDCGAAAGRAMEALRLGCRHLILADACPQRLAVGARAEAVGAKLLAVRPIAFDLPAAIRRRNALPALTAWLSNCRTTPETEER